MKRGFATPAIVACRLRNLLSQVSAAFFELLVMTHHHLDPAVSEQFSRLRQPGACFEEVGRNRMAIEVRYQVATQAQFLANAAKPAADAIAVPAVPLRVPEKGAMR